MRKHWIDNLRWVTVLLVLLYHVIYFYNNKGVFGGIGGFGDVPQYQDVVMYILYPWFMPLLFILAGISARYALETLPAKEWFKTHIRNEETHIHRCLHESRLKNYTLEDRNQGIVPPEHVALAKKISAADRIVIAAPFWDMSFPSALKVFRRFEPISAEDAKTIISKP